MTAAPPDQERRLKLKRASDVTATRVHWLFERILPLNTLSVLAGDSGLGKSTIALAWVAAATRGELPGDTLGAAVNVLIVSPEDDPGAVTRPRLEAAGADLDRVFFLGVERTTEHGEIDATAAFPADIPLLDAAVRETGAKLVIIDPIASTMQGNLDKREDVRASFDSLAALAQKYGFAVLLIAHNRKAMDRVRHRISGSAAITDAARSVLALARDEETGNVVLSIDKSSYSSAEGVNLAYVIEETSVDIPGGGSATTTRAVFVGETTVSVAELNARQSGDDHEGEDRSAALSFIIDYLTGQSDGEANAGDILKAGRAAGFNDQELKDARRRSKSPKVESRKASFGTGWVWGLSLEGVTLPPQGGTKVAKVAALETLPPSPPSMPPSDKCDNVVSLFPEAEGFELTSPPDTDGRLCVICNGTLAGRRRDAKTCSPTCRKKLSEQAKEATS